MTTNWFECAIKYERTSEEGKLVKVKEIRLIDALSFTEAEARITEQVQPYIDGEFSVSAVRRARIREFFFNENAERWFKAKVLFIAMDEEKGIEKKTACSMLVQADDIQDALDGIVEGMKGSMADYEIYSITNTDILEVVKYDKEE